MCHLSVEQNVSPVCWAVCATCLLSSMCYLSVEQYLLPFCWAVCVTCRLSRMCHLSVEQNVPPVCWAVFATCATCATCLQRSMCYLSAEQYVLPVCWVACIPVCWAVCRLVVRLCLSRSIAFWSWVNYFILSSSSWVNYFILSSSSLKWRPVVPPLGKVHVFKTVFELHVATQKHLLSSKMRLLASTE